MPNKRLYIICKYLHLTVYKLLLIVIKMFNSNLQARYDELFMRDCTFISNQPTSIKDFINGLSFEWKLSMGSYKLFNKFGSHQFCVEVLDIPNNVLGLPPINNWNALTINIDSNSLSGEVKKVKSDLLDNIGKYTNIEKVFCNRILFFQSNLLSRRRFNAGHTSGTRRFNYPA